MNTPAPSAPPTRLPLDDPHRASVPAPAPARSVADLPPADDEFFPDPDATRRLAGAEYGLPDGHWIEVRRTITFGQELHLQSQSAGKVRPGRDIELDVEAVTIHKLLAWLTGWSLTHRGQPAPLDEQHLRGLHPGLAAAINAAVDAHIQAVTQGNPYATSGSTRR